MNIFTITIIILFFSASALEAIHQRWLLCAFYALSALINIVVGCMGK